MNSEILLAIRIGPSSVVPAREAATLARRIGAHITVLHIAAELHPVDMAGADGLNIEEEQAHMLQEVEQELRTFITEHLSDVPADGRIVRGGVAEQVAAVAAEIDADYVVVGTHGRGALARLVLGDTTQSILQHTSRPVLVVPLQADAPAAE